LSLRVDHRPQANIDLRFLFARQLAVLGSYMGTMSDLHES